MTREEHDKKRTEVLIQIAKRFGINKEWNSCLYRYDRDWCDIFKLDLTEKNCSEVCPLLEVMEEYRKPIRAVEEDLHKVK